MKDTLEIKIGNNIISNNSATYFIADIAANWDGSLERAKKLIFLAAKAGANAAKFQNFNADTIISSIGFQELFKGKKLSHQSKWKDSVFDVYDKASLPIEWTKELESTCMEAGVDYLTTPYDLNQINELSPYVKAWKIGSGDITWHQLIEKLSNDNKPILLATGASHLNEVEKAVEILLKKLKKIVLFQCNTNYTASEENFKYINLNVLKTFRKKFPNIILGLSDHTPGHATVLGAVSLGARVIEKHFTDDNDREGPDHKFSMTPYTWKEMVERTRELEFALGSSEKKIENNERESVLIQRRSIRLKNDLSNGSILKFKDLIMLRPISINGLPPYKAHFLIGKKLNKNLKKGQEITFFDFKS